MTDELFSQPVSGDAFGGALVECLGQGIPASRVFEIIERDDGYIDTWDVAPYFTMVDSEHTRWVLERARGAVLDIGAGAGKWTLALQARSLDVLALDISPGAIAVCERQGVRRTFTGTIEALATSGGRERFDTFLLMGNNLGLLGGPDTAPSFLETLSRLASPGAHVLAVGNDAENTEQPEHLAYHELNRRRGRMPGQLRLRNRYRAIAGPSFDYLMPSLDALGGLLTGTGWSIAETLQEQGRSQYLVALTPT